MSVGDIVSQHTNIRRARQHSTWLYFTSVRMLFTPEKPVLCSSLEDPDPDPWSDPLPCFPSFTMTPFETGPSPAAGGALAIVR